MQSSHKLLIRFSCLLAFIYIILCCYFYKERSNYIDASFRLVWLLNGDFSVFHHRYSEALVYLLPWLAFKSAFSLNAIIFAFSLSFALFQCLIFLIALKVFKNPGATLLVSYIQLLQAKVLFFITLSEPMIVSLIGVLLFLICQSWNPEDPKSIRIRNLCGLVVASLMAIFFHPIYVFIFGFIILFDFARARKISQPQVVLLIMILLGSVVKYLTLDAYEQGLTQVTSSIWTRAYGVIILNFYIKYFLFTFIILFFSLAYYLFKREYLKVLAIAGSFLAYLLVVNVVNNLDKHSDLYSLHLNAPLVFFACAPFFIEIVGRLTAPARWGLPASVLLIIFLVCAGLSSVPEFNKSYQQIANRHFIIKSILDSKSKAQQSLLLIDERNMDSNLSLISYHIPYESMIISGLSGGIFQKTIVPLKLGLRHLVAPKQWRYFEAYDMNPLLINTPGDNKQLDPQFMKNIILNVKYPSLAASGTIFRLKISILNNNPTPIHSGFNKNYNLSLAYQWRKDGKPIASRAQLTPLLADVESSLIQLMNVYAPTAAGDYQLAIGFQSNELGWLGGLVTVPVTVHQ